MFPTEFLQDLVALGSVIIVDLVLAGDNALVVGMVACGLPQEQRRRAIVIGIVVAMVCRVAFSIVAVQLLAILGLLLAGGLLLLWVAWKMWRELKETIPVGAPAGAAAGMPEGLGTGRPTPKSFGMAITQIVIADVSMSLDNVLAVAGTARHNMWILAFGLFLSVALMGAAAGLVARYMARYHWLSYLGLAIVTLVALTMIYEGTGQIVTAMAQSN